MLQCAAFAGPTGSAFSFLPFPSFSQRFLSEWKQCWFSPAWGGWPLPPDSLTTGSHASNGAGNPSRWCRFPTLSPKPHTGPHRAEFWFSHQNEFTPPPKGGGAGFCSSLGFRVFLAVACGNCCSQPPHAGPTGPVWGFAGVVPLSRLSKPHTGSHRAEFGFTVFSWCASFAEVPLAGAPDGNSPPLGWDGW